MPTNGAGGSSDLSSRQTICLLCPSSRRDAPQIIHKICNHAHRLAHFFPIYINFLPICGSTYLSTHTFIHLFIRKFELCELYVLQATGISFRCPEICCPKFFGPFRCFSNKLDILQTLFRQATFLPGRLNIFQTG